MNLPELFDNADGLIFGFNPPFFEPEILISTGFSRKTECYAHFSAEILKRFYFIGSEFEATGFITPLTDPLILMEYGKADCYCGFELVPSLTKTQVLGTKTRRAFAYKPVNPDMGWFYFVEEFDDTIPRQYSFWFYFTSASVPTPVTPFINLFASTPPPIKSGFSIIENFASQILFTYLNSPRAQAVYKRCECNLKLNKFLEDYRNFALLYHTDNGEFPYGNDFFEFTINSYPFFENYGFGDYWRSLCYCGYYPYYFWTENSLTLILYPQNVGMRAYVLNITREDSDDPFASGIYQTIDLNLASQTNLFNLPEDFELFRPMDTPNPFPTGGEDFAELIRFNPADCVRSPIDGMIPAFEFFECSTINNNCTPQIEDVWDFAVGDNIRLFIPINRNVLTTRFFEQYQILLCDLESGETFDLVPRDGQHQSYSFIFDLSNEMLAIYVDFVVQSEYKGRCLRFCMYFLEGGFIDACSNPFVVVDSCESLFVRVKCEHNCLGYPYSKLVANYPAYQTSNYQQLRIRATINRSQNLNDTLLNKTSFGITNILYSKLTEQFDFETDYYATKKLNFITNLLHHDIFEVFDPELNNWDRFTPESGQSNLWASGYPQYHYAKLQSKLTRYKDFRRNNFC